MPLEPVHVMEIDRATSRLELVRVNPTRSFQYVALNENGTWASSPALYTWQNGKWYDTGENEITDLETIPRRFRDEIEANPVTAGIIAGPAVTGVCKICGEKMNESLLNEHYLKHYHDTVAQAGTITGGDKQHEPREKHDANQLGRT